MEINKAIYEENREEKKGSSRMAWFKKCCLAKRNGSPSKRKKQI